MARTKIRGNSQVIDESIVNGQIAPDAAIGRSKLADGTASRVVINDATGALADSSITSTELDALSGITDNIQDQLDSKVSYGGLKFNVIPSGTINGTNKIFTLNSNVFDDTHLSVFLNGVLQKPVDDYDLTDSAEITFVDAPETGDQIVVFYVDDFLASQFKSIAGSGSGSSGGSSFTPFPWSTTEQVYPFELGPNGETMYAKQVELPEIELGWGLVEDRATAHNISNLDVSSVRFFGHQGNIPLNYLDLMGEGTMQCMVKSTHVYQDAEYEPMGPGYIRIIYSKTS